MIFINKLNDIIDSYDYFFLDVWGVIHDGNIAYPGVVDTMKLLRQKGKKVCFLSNAPRRAFKVAEVLKGYGITPDLYDFILTSGEATYTDLAKNQKNNFQDFGNKYFYIGPKKDIDLLQGLNYEKVESAKLANFAVTTGFDHDESRLEEKLPQALEAKKYNLPMICVNPDLIVVRQNGTAMICAGALAAEYERIGGEVIYYGKPFSLVYKIACEIFFNIENREIPKAKIIAVGDGLETDIKGANGFGIDNILVTGGILTKSLGIKYNEVADKQKLAAICNDCQTFPKFVISNF